MEEQVEAVALVVYKLAQQSFIPIQFTQSQSVAVVLVQIPMGRKAQAVEFLVLPMSHHQVAAAAALLELLAQMALQAAAAAQEIVAHLYTLVELAHWVKATLVALVVGRFLQGLAAAAAVRALLALMQLQILAALVALVLHPLSQVLASLMLAVEVAWVHLLAVLAVLVEEAQVQLVRLELLIQAVGAGATMRQSVALAVLAL